MTSSAQPSRERGYGDANAARIGSGAVGLVVGADGLVADHLFLRPLTSGRLRVAA